MRPDSIHYRAMHIIPALLSLVATVAIAVRPPGVVGGRAKPAVRRGNFSTPSTLAPSTLPSTTLPPPSVWGWRGYSRYHANDSFIGRLVPCTADEKVCFRYNMLFNPKAGRCQPLGQGPSTSCHLTANRTEYERGSGHIHGICSNYQDPCPGHRMAYDGRCHRKQIVRDVICGCGAEPTRHILGGMECRCSPTPPITVKQPTRAGHCRIPDLRFPVDVVAQFNIAVPSHPAASAQANATEARANATGAQANAPGARANAPGARANAPGARANAPGARANAPEARANATGARANAPEARANATGARANATGARANATGARANATGARANATGARANATGARANATGARANVTEAHSSPPNCSAKQRECFTMGQVWVAHVGSSDCYPLLQRGPCAKDELVVLSRTEWARQAAECRNLSGGCPPGQRRMAFDSQCHNAREMELVAPGRIALDVFGEYEVMNFTEARSHMPGIFNGTCVVFSSSSMTRSTHPEIQTPPCTPGREDLCALYEISDIPPPELNYVDNVISTRFD